MRYLRQRVEACYPVGLKVSGDKAGRVSALDVLRDRLAEIAVDPLVAAQDRLDVADVQLPVPMSRVELRQLAFVGLLRIEHRGDQNLATNLYFSYGAGSDGTEKIVVRG